MSELEGLSRGGRSPAPGSHNNSADPQHVLLVAKSAKQALAFLKSRPQAVKCVTTKGVVLSSTTFTSEDDSTLDTCLKNDDKILATCLALSKSHNKEHESSVDGSLFDTDCPMDFAPNSKKCQLLNKCYGLPTSHTSADMLATEVGKIVLVRSVHQVSFILDSERIPWDTCI